MDSLRYHEFLENWFLLSVIEMDVIIRDVISKLNPIKRDPAMSKPQMRW